VLVFALSEREGTGMKIKGWPYRKGVVGKEMVSLRKVLSGTTH